MQEITRLSNLIDEIKAKNPSIKIPVQKPIVPTQPSQKDLLSYKENNKTPSKSPQVAQSIADVKESVQPLSGGKPPRSGGLSLHQGHTQSYIKGMKSNLNQLYKEVIVAITNDKAQETERGRVGSIASSRLDTSMNGESLSENLVRIEKKVNDVMLLLQEYIESLE